VAMLTVLILLLLLSGMVVTTAFSVSLYQSNENLSAEKESALVAKEAARAALAQSLAARIELTSESRRILSSSQARETLTQLASIRNPNIAEERALWTQAKSNVVSSHFDADFRSKTLLIPDERLVLPIAADPSGSCLVAACSSDGRTRLLLSQNSLDRNGDWQEIFELPNSSSPKQLLVSDNAKTIVYVTAAEEIIVLLRNVDGKYAQIQQLPILENAFVALARRGGSLAWASENTVTVISISDTTATQLITVEGQVSSLAFSDDSQQLAIANENRVAIWDLVSKEIVWNLEHVNPAAVCSIAWDRKGTQLLAGREDFHAYLWKLECPESPVAKLQGIQGWIRHVSFLAEDLALVGGESGCMLFDLATSQVARQSDGKVTSGWDHGMLLSIDGQVSMFELENSSIRQPISHGETNIAICSKTKPLLVIADYASVQIWNRNQQEIVREIHAKEVLWITCASSPQGDDDLVLVMQHDGVFAHPMLPGPGTRLLESEEFLPFGLVYSEQRGELIWLGTDSQLHRQNVFTGHETSVEFSTAADERAEFFSGSLAVSHCGEFVAIADNTRGQVSLFNLEKNSVSEVLPSTNQVFSMAVQEDAREIAIAASEGVTLVSKRDGTWIRTDRLSLPSAFWLEYDKPGRLHFALADGSLGRDSRVSADDEALTFHGGTKPFSNCTTPDGSTLYTVGRNLKLYRWNLEKIEELLSESTSPKQPASDRVFIDSNESALKESGI
ncbi:MAG: WD40 repeat domain-containing protein, partial [Planctomycetota bacterium]